ncbi:hypothetical protein Ndes2526B_g06420 [Nannochloris sp. 'desiccata']|nr:hypothetical protein KSW81_008184 [Chlorella desiccata (nom. nud.)]KAH7619448.1 hypothetical protein NADE_006289 [Chlorella desiccata (nom. nud.)]
MHVQRAPLKSFALAGDSSSGSSSSTSENLDQQQPHQQQHQTAATPLATPSTRIIGTSSGSVTTTQHRRQPTVETTSTHFGGALITLVFGAALLSERLNGIGIVQNLELHNEGFHPVLLGSILGLMCASAWPEKNERLNNPSKMVRMQMAFARIAYLGLAGAIAAEIYTGKGILTILDFETGVEAISDVEAVLAFAAMLFLTGPQSRTLK